MSDAQGPVSVIQSAVSELTEILQPYKQESSRRSKLGEHIEQVLRAATRDDFILLEETLRSKLSEEVQAEPGLETVQGPFQRLLSEARSKVERFRLEFVEQLQKEAAEADLPLEIDFPRLRSLKGIEGEIDFAKRQTLVNKKKIKSIDPGRIVAALSKCKRDLYDRPFDPQTFVDALFLAYKKVLDSNGWAPGHSAPLPSVYLEYVLSLQSKSFLADLDKGKFRGYPLEQFSVDLWRYFQSGTGGTSKGAQMRLDPGRGPTALWLIDSTGERRSIAGLSFQGGRK